MPSNWKRHSKGTQVLGFGLLLHINTFKAIIIPVKFFPTHIHARGLMAALTLPNVLVSEESNISDSNPYSGVELRPWTFQWDLTLHLLIIMDCVTHK